MIFGSVWRTQSVVNWFPFCLPHKLCLLMSLCLCWPLPYPGLLSSVQIFFHPAAHLKVLFPLWSWVAFSSSFTSFLPKQEKHSLFTCNLALFTHFFILRLIYKHSASLLICSKAHAKYLSCILPHLILSTILRIGSYYHHKYLQKLKLDSSSLNNLSIKKMRRHATD